MLMPKRTKHRKMFRGRMKGNAQRGTTVAFGEYGLQALEPSWITNRQIESCRVGINRTFKREGKTFIRIFPDKPITARPAGVRMGKGRSEEHTSELQSRQYLVCRLLLEKKKNKSVD